MSTGPSFNLRIPPWGLAATAMLSVQLGSALSVDLIATVGPAGTASLRLSMGALVLLAIARPPLRAAVAIEFLGPLTVAAVVGIPQAASHLTPGILAAAAGLAILLPVLPFALEMLALRRMTPSAFGTLMALEPALGVLLGLLILQQQPSATQVLGILLVVLAGSAAQRGGRRHGRAAPDRPNRPAATRIPQKLLPPVIQQIQQGS